MVKMMTKNKTLGIVLIITALTAGLIPVNASTNSLTAVEKQRITKTNQIQIKPNTLAIVQTSPVVDLSNLDESTIEKNIEKALEAEEIPEEETRLTPPLWYLNAYGYTIVDDPVTDAAETRNRVRLQLLAEKIKNTEFGALYKIHWGRVTHMGEKHTVEGYALLNSDGVFYMKLDGDLAFKSIGAIHPSWFGVRVTMKGYIVDDVTYSHEMRGWAIPLDLRHLTRLRNIQQ